MIIRMCRTTHYTPEDVTIVWGVVLVFGGFWGIFVCKSMSFAENVKDGKFEYSKTKTLGIVSYITLLKLNIFTSVETILHLY